MGVCRLHTLIFLFSYIVIYIYIYLYEKTKGNLNVRSANTYVLDKMLASCNIPNMNDVVFWYCLFYNSYSTSSTTPTSLFYRIGCGYYFGVYTPSLITILWYKYIIKLLYWYYHWCLTLMFNIIIDILI